MIGENINQHRSNIGPLIGVFLILVSVAGYAFFTRPLAGKVDQMQADVTLRTTEINDLKTKFDDVKAAEKEFDVSTEVQRLESLKAVPTDLNQDDVVRDLLSITQDNDILLSSVSFSKGSSTRDGIGSLRVSASFEGNYKDLTNFLEGLEQNARIFKVSNISVQLSRLDLSDIERANFSLTMETFFQN